MIRDSPLIRRRLLLGLYLALLGTPGCRRHPADHTNPFPVSDEVIGWERTSDVRAFEAADLWKYIDGEAERYLKAGVQTASTADYRFNNKSDAVVDVYTMGAVAGAEQIFESEPAAGADAAQVGDSARLYSQSLVFRKERYLVRITAYEDTPEMRPALVALAHRIEQRLAR